MDDVHHTVKIGQTCRGLRFDRRQELWGEVAQGIEESEEMLSYTIVAVIGTWVVADGKGCIHVVLVFAEDL